jgi:hypothetical protein
VTGVKCFDPLRHCGFQLIGVRHGFLFVLQGDDVPILCSRSARPLFAWFFLGASQTPNAGPEPRLEAEAT